MQCLYRGMNRVLDLHGQCELIDSDSKILKDSRIRTVLSYTPIIGIAAHFFNCHLTDRRYVEITDGYLKSEAEKDIHSYSKAAFASSLIGTTLVVSAMALGIITLAPAVILLVGYTSHMSFTAYHINNPSIFSRYVNFFANIRAERHILPESSLEPGETRLGLASRTCGSLQPCLHAVIWLVSNIVFGLHNFVQGNAFGPGRGDKNPLEMSCVRKGLSYTPGMGPLMHALNLHRAYCARALANLDFQEHLIPFSEKGGQARVKMAYEVAKTNAKLTLAISIGTISGAVIFGSGALIAAAFALALTSTLHLVWIHLNPFDMGDEGLKHSRATYKKIMDFFDQYVREARSPEINPVKQ